jgi:hypothetical protein
VIHQAALFTVILGLDLIKIFQYPLPADRPFGLNLFSKENLIHEIITNSENYQIDYLNISVF